MCGLILWIFKPHWFSINTLSILKESIIILTKLCVSSYLINSRRLYISVNFAQVQSFDSQKVNWFFMILFLDQHLVYPLTRSYLRRLLAIKRAIETHLELCHFQISFCFVIAKKTKKLFQTKQDWFATGFFSVTYPYSNLATWLLHSSGNGYKASSNIN